MTFVLSKNFLLHHARWKLVATSTLASPQPAFGNYRLLSSIPQLRVHCNVLPINCSRMINCSFKVPSTFNRTFYNLSGSAVESYRPVADSNPSDASKQREFLRLLTIAKKYNEVVDRYRSGKYAIDSDCTKMYISALNNLGRVDELVQDVHNVEASKVPGSAPFILGSKSDPIYIVGDQKSYPTTPDHRLFSKLLNGFSSLVLIVVGSAISLCFVGYVIYSSLQNVDSDKISESFNPMKRDKYKPELVRKTNVKFDDVQGCDVGKGELEEVVDFLKNPEKYKKHGAKMPKGVLLMGKPGTGKTLLAKALAGEAGVSFISCSGSEFDEVFVGLGASRIRALFAFARENAPCILFIDEIDSFAKKRNYDGMYNQSNTINQFLTEFDGFKELDGVIVVGATNVEESLDPAVLRPGRFDKKIPIDLPDMKGREAILKLHLRGAKLKEDVKLSEIAGVTTGLSGAELENIANHAKIRASKNNSETISMVDLINAKDECLIGRENRGRVITEDLKKQIAYHEGGHTIAGIYSKSSSKIEKVTILSRGGSLGHHFGVATKEHLITKEEAFGKLIVAMGGRAAEDLVFGTANCTDGAGSDIAKATGIAYQLVCSLGWSDKIGAMAVNYAMAGEGTKTLVDSEVSRVLKEAFEKARSLIAEHRDELDIVAKGLIERETLMRSEIEELINSLPKKKAEKASEPTPVSPAPVNPAPAPLPAIDAF